MITATAVIKADGTVEARRCGQNVYLSQSIKDARDTNER